MRHLSSLPPSSASFAPFFSEGSVEARQINKIRKKEQDKSALGTLRRIATRTYSSTSSSSGGSSSGSPPHSMQLNAQPSNTSINSRTSSSSSHMSGVHDNRRAKLREGWTGLNIRRSLRSSSLISELEKIVEENSQSSQENDTTSNNNGNNNGNNGSSGSISSETTRPKKPKKNELVDDEDDFNAGAGRKDEDKKTKATTTTTNKDDDVDDEHPAVEVEEDDDVNNDNNQDDDDVDSEEEGDKYSNTTTIRYGGIALALPRAAYTDDASSNLVKYILTQNEQHLQGHQSDDGDDDVDSNGNGSGRGSNATVKKANMGGSISMLVTDDKNRQYRSSILGRTAPRQQSNLSLQPNRQPNSLTGPGNNTHGNRNSVSQGGGGNTGNTEGMVGKIESGSLADYNTLNMVQRRRQALLHLIGTSSSTNTNIASSLPSASLPTLTGKNSSSSSSSAPAKGASVGHSKAVYVAPSLAASVGLSQSDVVSIQPSTSSRSGSSSSSGSGSLPSPSVSDRQFVTRNISASLAFGSSRSIPAKRFSTSTSLEMRKL